MALLDILTRRGILLGLGATAATGAVATGGIRSFDEFVLSLRPSGKRRFSRGLADAESGDWDVQLGSQFVASTGHLLELADVQTFPVRGARPGNLRSQAFIATFDIKKGGAMEAGLYTVRHSIAGVFEVALDSSQNPRKMVALYN